REFVGRILPTWFAREDLPPEMRAEQLHIEAYFDLVSAMRAYRSAESEAAQRLLTSALRAFPEWETTVFPETVAKFVGYVGSDPRTLIETVFENLPPEYTRLAGLKRDVYRRFLARVAAAGRDGEGPLGEA
ncbi:MAG TPA: hypothetical protein PKZ25_08695, partial [Candidatus Hydrogenedentes bacterium]|nr:hypothetical protein [Candidatus Hydrogenedentota bacterium]